MTLLVVGSLHLDVVVRAPHLPALDETVTGSGVDYVFGGKGGNQALAAARMGAHVSLAGCAGTDRFGDMIRDALHAGGVETSQLQSDPGPSGMSVAIVDAQGDYGAVIVSAANLQIEISQLTVPDGTKLVLLQNEIPEAINIAMARKAQAAGAQVWLNAAPARTVSEDLMKAVDLLIVNRVEDVFYRDTSGPVRLTTLGAQGVQFAHQIHPGFEVSVISTHGAGDTFVGALAAQVVTGVPLSDAIEFAQGAAALHVSVTLEARPSLTPENVCSFVAAQPNR